MDKLATYEDVFYGLKDLIDSGDNEDLKEAAAELEEIAKRNSELEANEPSEQQQQSAIARLAEQASIRN